MGGVSHASPGRDTARAETVAARDVRGIELLGATAGNAAVSRMLGAPRPPPPPPPGIAPRRDGGGWSGGAADRRVALQRFGTQPVSAPAAVGIVAAPGAQPLLAAPEPSLTDSDPAAAGDPEVEVGTPAVEPAESDTAEPDVANGSESAPGQIQVARQAVNTEMGAFSPAPDIDEDQAAPDSGGAAAAAAIGVVSGASPGMPAVAENPPGGVSDGPTAVDIDVAPTRGPPEQSTEPSRSDITSPPVGDTDTVTVSRAPASTGSGARPTTTTEVREIVPFDAPAGQVGGALAGQEAPEPIPTVDGDALAVGNEPPPTAEAGGDPGATADDQLQNASPEQVPTSAPALQRQSSVLQRNGCGGSCGCGPCSSPATQAEEDDTEVGVQRLPARWSTSASLGHHAGPSRARDGRVGAGRAPNRSSLAAAERERLRRSQYKAGARSLDQGVSAGRHSYADHGAQTHSGATLSAARDWPNPRRERQRQT